MFVEKSKGAINMQINVMDKPQGRGVKLATLNIILKFLMNFGSIAMFHLRRNI